MKVMSIKLFVAILAMATPPCLQAQTKISAPTVYRGAVDGSAAVPIDSTFFAAASDEDSVIRIYRRDGGGEPVWQTDLSSFLQVGPRARETDIEAAARIGNRAYWITSHGRSKSGKDRASRHRFFATDISSNEDGIKIIPVGQPYKNLLTELIADKQLAAFDLAGAAARAPKSVGGLNIEGLAATPDNHLLIGFRNPVPEGRALLIPLLNPDGVIEGKSARFGTPIRLDLGGLGIRDIAWWNGEFIIIAGRPFGGGAFRLFRWAGGDSIPKVINDVSGKNFNPEAVLIYPDKGLQEFQLLSDDSSEQKAVAAEASIPSARKGFRSMWITP